MGHLVDLLPRYNCTTCRVKVGAGYFAPFLQLKEILVQSRNRKSDVSNPIKTVLPYPLHGPKFRNSQVGGTREPVIAIAHSSGTAVPG
jgi:hypothetical protein